MSARGELNAAPEAAYAHWLAAIREREHTVFCHVGGLPCGDGGEPGATKPQVDEVLQMIDAMTLQMPGDIRFVSAALRDAEATLQYTGRDAKGAALRGVVEMERQVYGHWRIVAQDWQPAK